MISKVSIAETRTSIPNHLPDGECVWKMLLKAFVQCMHYYQIHRHIQHHLQPLDKKFKNWRKSKCKDKKCTSDNATSFILVWVKAKSSVEYTITQLSHPIHRFFAHAKSYSITFFPNINKFTRESDSLGATWADRLFVVRAGNENKISMQKKCPSWHWDFFALHQWYKALIRRMSRFKMNH